MRPISQCLSGKDILIILELVVLMSIARYVVIVHVVCIVIEILCECSTDTFNLTLTLLENVKIDEDMGAERWPWWWRNVIGYHSVCGKYKLYLNPNQFILWYFTTTLGNYF